MVNDIYFSQPVKAGKRIYYMDVKKSRKNEFYLSITESKKIVSDEEDNTQQVTFEKHKIFLYKEDFAKFVDGLSNAIKFIHEHSQDCSEIQPLSGSQAASATETVTDNAVADENPDDIKIEF